MGARGPSRGLRRMEELCAIRRSLTDAEVAEVLRLRVNLRRASYFADYKRDRYANDEAYRTEQRSRSAEYKARRRAERAQS